MLRPLGMRKITRMNCRITILLIGMLLGAAAPAGYADGDSLPPMGIAYSQGAVKNSNLNDIKASSKVWIDTFGRPTGICRAGDVHVFKEQQDWRSAVAEESFLLGILLISDYLALEKEGILDPLYVFKNSAGIGDELLLLVHQDSGINSLDGLAGRELFFSDDAYADIAKKWMHALLADQNLAPTKDFFKSTVDKTKASGALLPVFFKRDGACVVTAGSFETMKELNPQVGRKLKVLARSPNYLSSVVCLRHDCEPELARRVDIALATLHEDTAGRQLLMAFRINEFTPYKPEYTDTLRTLFKRCEKLKQEEPSLHRDGEFE